MNLANGTTFESFGCHVNGSRHFARCARHATIGDECHPPAPVLQNAKNGGKLMQFRHAIGTRALEAHHRDKIPVKQAILESLVHVRLLIEDHRRRFNHAAVFRHGGSLDDGTADISFEKHKPTRCIEGISGRAQDFGCKTFLRPIAPNKLAILQHRLAGVSAKAVTGHGLHILMQQSGVDHFADQEGHATSGVEMVHIRHPIGIDAAQKRHDLGKIGKIFPVNNDARRTRHGNEMDRVIGGPTRRVKTCNGIHNATLIDNLTERNVAASSFGQFQRAGGGSRG